MVMAVIKRFRRRTFSSIHLGNQFFLQPAQNKHIPFITDSIIDGAGTGAFNSTYVTNQEAKSGLIQQIRLTINLGYMPVASEFNVKADLGVITYHDDYVGFVWIKDFMYAPGSELYMVAINEDLRGEGLGHCAVKAMLSPLNKGSKCYVRVYETDNCIRSKKMLKQLGFTPDQLSREFAGTTVFSRLI